LPGPHTPIDFAALADALLQRVHGLLAQWLPGGHMEGHEYVGPSRRSGGVGDSLKVNTTTGRWAFFAGDDSDSGGDLISLYAWLNNVGQGEAAKQLMDELGWQRSRASAPAATGNEPPAWHSEVPDEVEAPPAAAPAVAPSGQADAAASPAPANRERWQSVLPVPPHAKPPKQFIFGFKNEKLRTWQEIEASRVWEYRFERELFGYVCRFERFNSSGELVKDTVPLTWCEDTHDERRGARWHWKTWATPRPLYVPATLLSGDPTNVPVVIVEGEKCAEAGHKLLGHEFDFISWPGGSRSWALARWGWIMGRTVYLWPDCDAARVKLTKAERDADVDPATKPLLPEAKQPGMQAMVGIGSLLVAEQACTVLMCPVPKPGAVAHGWDIADAIDEGWDAARVRDFIRSARPFAPPDEGVRAKAVDPAAAADQVRSTPSRAAASEGDDAEAPGWLTHLLRSGSGAVRNVRENIVLALDGLPGTKVAGIEACAGLIGFNEFSNTIEKRRATPWGTPAGDWQEADELLLGDWLVREHRMPSMPRGALEEAVMVVGRRHSFHPLRARMEALRGQWDKEARLDKWLRLVCLEEDEWDDSDPLMRYLALAGRWFVMGMVARVMPEKREGPRVVVGPGTKFDYMLVFEGPQGWGKSSAAAVLGGEYFADTGLDLEHKDSLMNIQGVWVYEWSELENLNKQEVGAVKRFVSSPTDRFRATFDRRPAKYPRQVVFIGTTNESHYLTDPTGNRRFWPVRVTRPPDLVWLRANLEQLLAEAVHRVDAGERFWPTREEQKLLFDAQQQARTVESGMESAVRQLLYDENQKVFPGEQNGAFVNEIGMAELLKRIGYSTDKQTDAVVKKAGAVMHSLGWAVRRTSQPGRPRVYVRPKDEPRNEPGASPGSDPGAPGAPETGADDEYPF
jgi:putative DNA primase/helicase